VGDCLSYYLFLDPLACVATVPDLQRHTMDYDVKEKKALPNRVKKNPCVTILLL